MYKSTQLHFKDIFPYIYIFVHGQLTLGRTSKAQEVPVVLIKKPPGLSQSTESPKHLGALGFIFNCGGGLYMSPGALGNQKKVSDALKLEL